MKKNNIRLNFIVKICFGLALVMLTSIAFGWGFYGHKLINRLAIFTLPEKLMGFYKQNIDYITEHAVDADKRRYTDSTEACKHYIDLDYYESHFPIDTVPKFWKDAEAKYTKDTLLAYGIVPWHIVLMKWKLTEAFKEKNVPEILKISADIGHYIGDSHVPLHATMNYNGQLTNQKGIHGFWESRLPELFATNYDFFVGRAVYVNDVQELVWQAISASFNAKDSVLLFEKELSQTFDADKKYSLEQKGTNQVKVYSVDYANAYHQKLNNQVERRIRASVWAVGCIWYTAWVDAGQPDLIEGNLNTPASDKSRKKMIAEEQQLLNQQKMIGRQE